ncbi:MAG TPA: EAL domain-containing protein [Vicinamibacteria bacterium]|nr:EAL domain-containing protein [Vicinamibacteria bacterium]
MSIAKPAVIGNVFEAAERAQSLAESTKVRSAREPIRCYREYADEIHEMLAENRCLALLYVDASNLAQIEHDYGNLIHDQVRSLLTNLMLNKPSEFRRDDLVTVSEPEGDTFLVFLSGAADLEGMADRIHADLTRHLSRMTSPYLKGKFKVGVGYSLVLHNPLINEERLVLQLIDDARAMSRFQEYRIAAKSKELLQRIILKEDVRTIFQPILDLTSLETIGFEALTRGPQAAPYESPQVMFDLASEANLQFELDRLCRRRAFSNASRLKQGRKLFVNLLPTTLRDPEFQGERIVGFLEQNGLSPSRIVLEITERLAIENYDLFLDALKKFTDMGFSIAIDDMGAGYSGLEKIVRLNPRYLKFDLMMVRDIHTSFVKREMLKAIHALSTNIGADVIAEGVEQVEELDTLLELGIPYGQGYLFARPQERLTEPNLGHQTIPEVPGLIVD